MAHLLFHVGRAFTVLECRLAKLCCRSWNLTRAAGHEIASRHLCYRAVLSRAEIPGLDTLKRTFSVRTIWLPEYRIRNFKLWNVKSSYLALIWNHILRISPGLWLCS